MKLVPTTMAGVARLCLLVAAGTLGIWLAKPAAASGGRFRAVDRVPAQTGPGRLAYNHGQMVLHVAGSPRDLGRQHGRLVRRSLRLMLDGYIGDAVTGGDRDYQRTLLKRVRRMREALPRWYRDEVAACAREADVDEDLLLLAQCEGDIRSLGTETNGPLGPACSAYVVFGPAAQPADGPMRIGRNFDYFGGDYVHHCALVTYVTPAPGDGLPFVCVGWSGILGGWTLVNQAGLVVANHLGGGWETNPDGVPTLILTRILAQTATDIDQALGIIRRTPRMRGQIVWLAQPASADGKRPARAVAVEYDAKEVAVREAEDGLLVVTNANRAFHRSDAYPVTDWEDYATTELKEGLAAPRKLGDHPISATWRSITLHTVEVQPAAGRLFVAHGCRPAQDGPFVEYALPKPGGP